MTKPPGLVKRLATLTAVVLLPPASILSLIALVLLIVDTPFDNQFHKFVLVAGVVLIFAVSVVAGRHALDQRVLRQGRTPPIKSPGVIERL
ncbi:MAG: hypothetical protein P8Q36_08650 [Alphaproteobacteria bacterium]|jgi:hypothetical protein|nr:hypothetical protein [Rhodospirillaceae bacterium]MDG2480922.1 hypothetical protein [Alphaproteobacteria bacterium]MBT6205603.1 hypothetical protein [Rhodospirillaceae bacterium]MBT6509731.1 hypothetical protein [Rhodospirillaceae bacterium]MBT7612617.1 hypothetical protein [Rhodospirillaceae bacterium]